MKLWKCIIFGVSIRIMSIYVRSMLSQSTKFSRKVLSRLTSDTTFGKNVDAAVAERNWGGAK